MHSQPTSTCPDSTPAAEQQPLVADEFSKPAEPIPTFGVAGIYLRLLNLWHAATFQAPGPSRMMVRQCPRCGALSASPDEALLQTWLRVHCCQAKQHGKDVI